VVGVALWVALELACWSTPEPVPVSAAQQRCDTLRGAATTVDQENIVKAVDEGRMSPFTSADVTCLKGADASQDWLTIVAERAAASLIASVAPPAPVASPASAAVAPSGRLAVLELSGSALQPEERSYLSDAVRGAVLSAMGRSVAVMTRENMEVMLTDMGLDATCMSEGACEVETARNLGVDWVVTGTMVVLSGQRVLSLKLHETRTGSLLAQRDVRGADVLSVSDQVGDAVAAMVSSAGVWGR
jgi:TolB-like protein